MQYVRVSAKWLAVALCVGLPGGALGALFHHGVELATRLRTQNPWTLWLLPLCGVGIALLYQLLHTQGLGTNAIIDAVHQGRRLPVRLIPAIFVGTVLTHLCGGSAGREGAALQIGGDLGEHLAQLFRLDDKDTRIATLCGMSALFSALFGTPLTAVFFAMEVISVGVLYYAALLPCLTASLTAYAVASRLFHVAPTRFFVSVPALDAMVLVRVAVLALGCAMVSILFCEAMHRSEQLAARLLPNVCLRAFCGGCLVIVLTLAVGCRDYNGAGMDVITAALSGTAKGEAFLLKIVFTAVTLGCGFKGGEVIPTFFVGAVFGCTAAGVLALPAPFAAAVGIVSLFCGVVNCPVSSILLSIELFGAEGLVAFAVACAVSYVFSGYRGLYHSQTILYSKLRAEFVNRHTK